MRAILIIAGLLSLAVAFMAGAAMRTDIQVGIAVDAAIGAFVLFGLAAVLGRLPKRSA